MRLKFRDMLVLGTILASLVLASLADEETLNGADSNTITVLDPRKLTRSSSNINAAAINSLTGSGTVPSADGKSNETTLIFATHVTEPAPQLETHSELNNQLGQTVYLQAQPQPQHNHHDHQQSPHHGGQFLYPQPAPVQSGNLGSHGSTLNAPGASPPYLLHPGYGVQYVQYVPRPVVMPNYPPPPSVYGQQHPAQYSNLPQFPPVPHHHPHQYHSHPPGIPQSAQFILPPPPGHHTIPSVNRYNIPHHSSAQQNHHNAALQSSQNSPSHQHLHPQTHFLAGPPSQPHQVPPTSTYASGSAVGQPQTQSQQPQQYQSQQQLQQSPQGQATSPPISYLTYSSPSHHYHMSQPHLHHQVSPQNPTAQPSNLIQSHVQPPQQQQQPLLQQAGLQGQQPQQQQLIGSYSQQAPLYSYIQPQQQQGSRYGGPTDSFLNTNEYLPNLQYDNTQFRAIKRNSKA